MRKELLLMGNMLQKGNRMEFPEYFNAHRGGSGQVVTVTAIHDLSEEQRLGIFGSIEKAKAWRDTLGDTWTCVYAPFIVDDPEFGNRTEQ